MYYNYMLHLIALLEYMAALLEYINFNEESACELWYIYSYVISHIYNSFSFLPLILVVLSYPSYLILPPHHTIINYN